jgi:hypothetical protein
MITKNLIIAKDFCTYRRIFLHQEKIIRDHAMSYRPRRTHAIPQKWSMVSSGGDAKASACPE